MIWARMHGLEFWVRLVGRLVELWVLVCSLCIELGRLSGLVT